MISIFNSTIPVALS